MVTVKRWTIDIDIDEDDPEIGDGSATARALTDLGTRSW